VLFAGTVDFFYNGIIPHERLLTVLRVYK
jgi:hypothetical protein